jgi:hypothetical protein
MDMGIDFEWNPQKAEANRRKHGVTFDEASSVFADPLSVAIPDPDHSEHEARMVLIGRSSAGSLLVVAHTEAGERIRLISARRASRREQRHYEESSD